MVIQIRKPENEGTLVSNEKKNSGQELDKIELRLPERKWKMNSLNIEC